MLLMMEPVCVLMVEPACVQVPALLLCASVSQQLRFHNIAWNAAMGLVPSASKHALGRVWCLRSLEHAQ